MGAKKHSDLGASKAEQWMNCTASIGVIKSLTRVVQENEYMHEGTLAHECAERILNRKLIFSEAENEYGKALVFSVKKYTAYVRSILKEKCQLFVEKKVVLDFVRDDMFGTCDAYVYNPENKTLEVIDYKHGYQVVEIKDNYQLKYYALGAYHELTTSTEDSDKKINIEEITITIVQPNAKHEDGIIRSETFMLKELLIFKKLLENAVMEIENSPNFSLGAWCKRCEGCAICPMLHEKTMEVTKAHYDIETKKFILPNPQDLTGPELKNVLDFSDMAKTWLKSIRAYATHQADTGVKIPGYKLISKKGNREWIDPTGIKRKYHSRTDIYNTTLKSPAQFEKIGVPKEEIKRLWKRVEKGSSLVCESDKRIEIRPSVYTVFNEN